jgi:hypothetical protein
MITCNDEFRKKPAVISYPGKAVMRRLFFIPLSKDISAHLTINH